MSTFELNNVVSQELENPLIRTVNFDDIQVSNLKENENSINNCSDNCILEPIIANKIYDLCRQQHCLAEKEISAAKTLGGLIKIIPPIGTTSVEIKDLFISAINIVRKEKNPFRRGYYDLEIQYVFEYILVFKDALGLPIELEIIANSFYNKKCTLFGSSASDIVSVTDSTPYISVGGGADPFVAVSAKAIAMSVSLQYPGKKSCNCCPTDIIGSDVIVPDIIDFDVPIGVLPVIGLFTVIKLFRTVDLTVKSEGFCIPSECTDCIVDDPCSVFSDIDFPLDNFAPPQKRDFN